MKPEYRELIELYLQDSCSETQLEEILDLVSNNDKFRSELAEAGRIQGLLSAVNNDSYENLSQKVMRNAGGLEESELESKILEQLTLEEAPQKSKSKAVSFFLWSAIAAQIAIIFVLFGGKNEISEPVTSLASLYSEGGQAYLVRNGKEIPIDASLRLMNGDGIRVEEKGDVSITWNDSTVLQFKEKSLATFSVVEGAKRINFEEGTLEAKVTRQKQGKPLVIETPNSFATVLGTKFQLRVNQLESMLEVSRGAVELKRKANQKKVVVSAHEYAISSPTQEMKVSKMNNAAYRSHEITLDTPDRKVDIVAEINGSRKIYLVVNPGSNGISFDHAGWLQPRLEDALGREFSLLNLKWNYAESEWGVIGVGTDAQGDILMHKRMEHIDGIGTHALSVIEYDIPEGYRLFKATGVITDSGANQTNSRSSVVFEVYTEFPEQHFTRLKLSSKGK